MLQYTDHTSERAIQAIINAGKLDAQIIDQDAYANLAWSEKLLHLIQVNLINEEQLVTLFAKSASLTRAFPDPETINLSALISLPYRFILEQSLLPYALEDNVLRVLIIDPRTMQMKSELRKETSFEIQFDMTSMSHLTKLLQDPKINEALKKLSGHVIPEVFDSSSLYISPADGMDETPSPEEETKEIKKEVPKKEDFKKSTQAQKTIKERWNVNDPDLVIDFCNQILFQAIQEGVSDIHIECFRDFANVRMRKDGGMQSVDFYGPYLFKNYAAVTTRFKILAECDISEKRLPQDGAITYKEASGREVDFRFNVMPTKNGERIVMRILAGDPALSLDKIGFDPQDYEKVIDAITAPQGMVLVTGPTGSGKTTTLYGALQYINKPDINILTAEDPVEYYLEGAGQVQANEKIGLTFSSILRAFLRQDPEVILVGEIRDQETIDIAIKAALTGHLLLSTLHTNDAISTITRILNMGVPNFMISSALSLIIAQRLARKNCPACSEEDTRITPEILKKCGFEGDLSLIKPKRGVGCKLCDGKGQKGRQGIYEVLRITPSLEEAILKNEQAPALLAAAKKDGFKTMQEIGREFVAKGVISIEEFQSTVTNDA